LLFVGGWQQPVRPAGNHLAYIWHNALPFAQCYQQMHGLEQVLPALVQTIEEPVEALELQKSTNAISLHACVHQVCDGNCHRDSRAAA
jgi:hypothetical protein